jgi:GNAT superfamily N-acetyltransferase
MIRVEVLTMPFISNQDMDQLISLSCAVHPSLVAGRDGFAEKVRRTWQGYSGSPELAGRRFIARHEGRIVANANLFPRPVITSRGPETIAAIAGVSSHPDVRGMGFGKAVVRAIFDRIDADEFPFALFQTGEAREFYEKLGCTLVPNTIVNSRDEQNPDANPFWDKWVMCYAPRGLPEGNIDLLGKGY